MTINDASMTLTQSIGQTHPIPTIDAASIEDVNHFYATYAHTPLIIRGVFPPDHPLCQVQLADIADWFRHTSFSVYSWDKMDDEMISAMDVFNRVNHDVTHYNVVDHKIVDTPLGDLFTTPSFLSCNWFLGAPLHASQLEKSLVLSPKGSFTPLHLDAYGMQGWMYLIAGCKRWEFYAPKYVHSAFDPVYREFFNPDKHRREQFPLLALTEKYVGTMQSGDLVYFPAGWIHQVETIEPSWGVGGNLINDYQIEAHMYWWLWERTFKLNGSLDLKQAILEMSPEQFSSPQGMAQSRAALKFCQNWEQRMQNIDALAWRSNNPEL